MGALLLHRAHRQGTRSFPPGPNPLRERSVLNMCAVLPWPQGTLIPVHQEPNYSFGGQCPNCLSLWAICPSAKNAWSDNRVPSGILDSIAGCAVAVNMLLLSHEKDTYNHPIRRQRQRSDCRYPSLLWRHERCRCYSYCLAGIAETYHQPCTTPTRNGHSSPA